MHRIDQRVVKNHGAAFGYSGFPVCELTRILDCEIKDGKGQDLSAIGEAVDITDLPEDHPGFDISDTRDGHNDGGQGLDDLLDPSFVIINLSIQQLDLFNGLSYLNRAINTSDGKAAALYLQ